MGSQEWFVQHGGKVQGPFTPQQLKQLAKANKIQHQTQVRLGDSEWKAASRIKGLFDTLSTPEKISEISLAKPIQKTAVASHPIPTTIVVEAPPLTKNCPFCGDPIAIAAVKCKHCGEFLDPALRAANIKQSAPAPAPVMQQLFAPAPAPIIIRNTNINNVGNNRKRWSPLMAGFLSLLIPGLGQVYKGQAINGLVWFLVTIGGYVAFIIPGLILHVLCVLGALLGDPYR